MNSNSIGMNEESKLDPPGGKATAGPRDRLRTDPGGNGVPPQVLDVGQGPMDPTFESDFDRFQILSQILIGSKF